MIKYLQSIFYASRYGKFKLFFLAVLTSLTLLVFTQTCYASSKENLLKAVFIEKFTHFIEWQNLDSDILICIYGKSETGDALRDMVKSQKIKGYSAKFALISENQPILGCHILFVSNELEHDKKISLINSPTPNVLTIGDSSNFAKHGGMISFIPQGEKLRFEINQTSAQNAGIKISSRLLKLATKVYRGEEN